MLNKLIQNYSSYSISYYLINILIILLPISFIAGNLIINLNIFLLIFFGLIFYGKKIYELKLFFFDKFLIFIFAYLLFSGIFNSLGFSEYSLTVEDLNVFIKTIAFLRYLFFYLIIRLLIQENVLNFKLFFSVTSVCVIFVCLDLILQFISGKDIFGFIKTQDKLSGPFGEEKIAGSYLQRFGIFSFFIIPLILTSKKKSYFIFLSLFLFALIFTSIVISGNRMPLLLFLLMFLMLFFIEKKLRGLIFIFFIIGCLFFLFIFYSDDAIRNYTFHFMNRSEEILTFLKEVILFNETPQETNTYIKEFNNGYAAWLENPIIGGGIDSFYLNCEKTREYCTNHPHNYYLEIMSELGIVGLILIIILFINLITIFFNVNNYVSMTFQKNLITPFVLLMLVEIFPLKTTGSFFTTANSTFIFLIMAIIIGLYRKSIYNKV